MGKSPLTAQAMDAYRNLMLEIKYRTDAIDDALAGKMRMRARITEEHCYLQLRMICEVLAIACLVVHGSLNPRPKLFQTHKADFIMKELEKLHSKFFPQPLEEQDAIGPFGVPDFVHRKSGFLSHKELQTLWNRQCGNMLHRGNARDILSKEREPDFAKVSAWRDKIVALLNRHVILTPDEEWMFYVVMHEQNTGNVASNLFQRQPQPVSNTK